MTAPLTLPRPESVAEYESRLEALRADYVAREQVSIRAAVLAERARNLAGVRPDVADAA